MKKLFFSLLALLVSSFAFSQARSLVVKNQTNCTQYYIIVGDDPCQCGDKYYSPLYSIPPGGTHTYATTMTLGGSFPTGTPNSIVAAKIPDGPVACMVAGSNVSEKCLGMPPSYTFMSIKESCYECEMTTATWKRAQDCDSQAELLFTP